MEERFAPVTAATGALGPVLKKLTDLLGDRRYKLHEKTRGDIESIKSELEPVHHLLGKLWGRDDLDVACKDWMTEARELSYDMEDDIDDFTLGLERRFGSFIQREATDSPFKEFMERVKDVSKKCGKMQKIGDAMCNRSKLTTDPRALFLHKDASELVGMEEKKEEVIQLLQKHEMVCILGPGGMGKTTLADLVYQTIGHDEFQCRAFVSVHPSPNMTEILGTILNQVTDGAMSAGSGTEQNMVTDISISLSEKSGTEPAAEQNDFIKGISNFLSDKRIRQYRNEFDDLDYEQEVLNEQDFEERYLVIIDDIWRWEEWEVIRKALPKDNLGCKIIMTTRVRSIAEKCETEQGAGVYEQKFGRAEAERLSFMRLMSKSVEGTNAKELSTKIADMCGGPPFYFCPLAVICLSSAWAESHHVQGDEEEWDTWARHALDDGFLSTPSLKPWVQSLCLGFDDLPVQLRTCLLYCTIYPPKSMPHKGRLVRKWIAEGFVSQVEVAEAYFDKLVSRNLLKRVGKMHAVHPIMRAFLVCKAKEDNFIAYEWGGNSSHAKQIRRLSLSTDRCPDEDVLSHTRSLVVCGDDEDVLDVPFKAIKKLRVLGIHGWTRVIELPKEIWKLQHLRTLDITGTKVRELPWEVQNSINVLVGEWSSVKMARELSCSGGEEVIISSSEAQCRDDLSILILFNHFGGRCEVLPVPMHRVAGRHMKVPQWVKQDLCNVCSLDITIYKLVHEDLKFLKTQMPNLQALQLRFEVLPREPVAITDGGFSKLETFYVDCRLPWVIFGKGAMPKLKHLEFKFVYTGTVLSRQDYVMGIKHLDSLEKVVFRCSEYCRSDSPGIRETIDVLRKEAVEHLNKITLWVDGMHPEVFGSGAAWISIADKAIVEKRDKLFMAAQQRIIWNYFFPE